MSSVTNPTSSRKPFDCLIDRQKACRQAAELPRTIHTYSGIFSLIQQESYVKSRNRNISVFIEVIYCCCPLKQHFEVMKPTGKHFETMRKNTFSIYTIGYGVERINEGGTQLARSCNKLKSQRAEPSISFFSFRSFSYCFLCSRISSEYSYRASSVVPFCFLVPAVHIQTVQYWQRQPSKRSRAQS